MEFALQSTRKLCDLAYKISRVALLFQRKILRNFQESLPITRKGSHAHKFDITVGRNSSGMWR